MAGSERAAPARDRRATSHGGYLSHHDGVRILTRDEVLRLGAISPDIQGLSADVHVVADRLQASAADKQGWAWQHLLLAVVNFKANLKLYPAPLPHWGLRPDVVPPVPWPLRQVAGPCPSRPSRRIPGRASSVKYPAWECRAPAPCSEPCDRSTTRSSTGALCQPRSPLSGSRFGRETTPFGPASTRAVRASGDSYRWYREAALGTVGKEGL
jgi:hypothetical protein